MNLVNDEIPEINSSSVSLLNELFRQLKNHPVIIDEFKLSLEKYFSSLSDLISPQNLADLLLNAGKASSETGALVFKACRNFISGKKSPWFYIEHLLSSKEKNVIFAALDIMKYLVSNGSLKTDTAIIKFFADKLEIEKSVLASPEAFEKTAEIFSLSAPGIDKDKHDPVLDIYINHPDIKCRIFAARLLDLKGKPAPPGIIEKILGSESSGLLSSYFNYTRINYSDLFFLMPEPGKPSPAVNSIKTCEKICGEGLIKEVITRIGWKAVNYGLFVTHYSGVSFSGSLPVFMSCSDAGFLEKAVNSKTVSDYFLFTGHGGLPFETVESSVKNKPVELFRRYNLAHAVLLKEILDIAPLDANKIRSIINQLDKLTADFVTLFEKYSEECSIVWDVFKQIRDKVLEEIENNPSGEYISADTTRLVQMFEDPHSIGEVHTLHGLKRYLHQKGLQLGFKIVDQSRSPNKNITLVLASGTKIISAAGRINYADFESEEELRKNGIPYPVAAAVKGFERQILYGETKFPSLNIFCYGNEVHYFIWFRNHPVFVRIDFSPPLHGGMIDLQYFGVSNYEIADHPNINLDAIKYFFEYMEFDVNMNGTHIHARYDKERALQLNQLCEKVEYLFCLAPYLMDLDWIIGSLNLDTDAKQNVIQSWAKFFMRWGIVPVNQVITKDKLGILKQFGKSPEGEFEIYWHGDDEYADRYSRKIPEDFFEQLFNSADSFGIKIPKFIETNFRDTGQLYLEKKFLKYLHEALSEGEIIYGKNGFIRTPDNLFRRIHEAEIFAELLSQKGENLFQSVVLAKILMPVEQALTFKNTGTLESFKAQCTELPLRGYVVKIYALRDHCGIIRMAFYVNGSSPFRSRKNGDDTWENNICLSASELQSLLRQNNYTVKGSEPVVESIDEEIKSIYEELNLHYEQSTDYYFHNERTVSGLSASPGKAVGRILFGSSGRLPEEFNDHIFAASSISPEDNTVLFHSAGILATGGGILSHAGLIANQFGKPSLIIEGNWVRKPDNFSALNYRVSEFSIEQRTINNFKIHIYSDFHEKDQEMFEGDLVVIDADEGKLQVLGQDTDTIALYEGLKSLGRTNEKISLVTDDKELLIYRGKKLHILHQVEKLLQKIIDNVLCSFALQEILIGNFLKENKSTYKERTHLLDIILKNERTGEYAQKYLSHIINKIENKLADTYSRAVKNITKAKYPFEAVMPRLEVLRISEMMRTAAVMSGRSEIIKSCDSIESEIDKITKERVDCIKDSLLEKINNYKGCPEKREFLRHLFRQLTRINLLKNDAAESDETGWIQISFKSDDEDKFEKLSERLIIKPGEGALELVPLIGWKAANLSELELIGGKGMVPDWFVITDNAFRELLKTVIKENITLSGIDFHGGITLRQAIDKIITGSGISNKEKSDQIRNLWDVVTLPEKIKNEILKSYREIINISSGENNFAALRSSSCEEDAEIAARAGEFDTYLFINGEESLIEFTKKTWSGLWTERGIHNRSILGTDNIGSGGGVIVQKMIRSRVSGVLQTINAAKGDLREIVINAGLGLGEGVVSGAVSADQVIISKEGNLEKGPLHFNYITADKSGQVVYNKNAGFGTVLTPVLYHQRFRPALEYIELCELAAIASQLEAAYGYPLDIEFGIEGTKLWILQVRPVAAFLPVFNETIKNYPLKYENNGITQEKIK